MTDFIEKIELGPRYTDYELENTTILLNIDCPICGKHEVYARSFVINNPVLTDGDVRGTMTIGCIPCGEQIVSYIWPELTMEDYKDFINKAMVYNWLDAVSKDPNVHAWRRDRLFDVANGKEPSEFWRHAYDARLRVCASRHKESPDMLKEEEE